MTGMPKTLAGLGALFCLASAGQERLELARAYIDLGDIETARGLLQEVAVGGEAEARGEAERLLRELA